MTSTIRDKLVPGPKTCMHARAPKFLRYVVWLLQPKVAYYYVTREISVRPARPAGRPRHFCHAPVSRSNGWSMYRPPHEFIPSPIDSARRAESIGEGIRSGGGLYMLHPERRPSSERDSVSRSCVTLCDLTFGCMAPFRRLTCYNYNLASK